MTETEYDKMVVVKVLYQSMNWSFRRIGRCLSTDSKTVKSIYNSALEELTSENIHNFPKGRKGIDLRYIGDTSDVEYVEGVINHSVTGGGRKIDQTYRD